MLSSNENENIYLKEFYGKVNRNNLYSHYLHLYHSFHWQGGTVATLEYLCEKNGFIYTEQDNMPLNRKFNAASRLAKKTNPEAVYLMGSDDWITSEAIINSLKMIDKGHSAVGLLDLYFFDLPSLFLTESTTCLI